MRVFSYLIGFPAGFMGTVGVLLVLMELYIITGLHFVGDALAAFDISTLHFVRFFTIFLFLAGITGGVLLGKWFRKMPA
ncbi:MAG: hypothetical protein COU47_02070 [Candidatus Niyogibacteria bacterium CG10_big_fil_rev_8_21_14_0_10_46_36]|uniref:Uncharacterized protein n=1 Tax=Candidatus Niyogibacteria bacterium CG10_big_fil_rev_8_21_14_0_10_46_36 TaxID=1974726 RepID=A0A2H0TDN9_9BACT|nr:MAG: hypothetical protein COU47_02070 [Candidatus Niyogibacteria bacterium CG10_big_fil_rev_8_21_14_0_10_46_36]